METYELYNDLIGKPFLWGGRGPDGYDCLGLCIEIYRRLNKTIPDINSPEKNDICMTDKLLQIEKTRFIKIKNPVTHCLIAFKLKPPFVSHLGVMTEGNRNFIHVHRNQRVCIKRLDNWWRQRIEGFYIYE